MCGIVGYAGPGARAMHDRMIAARDAMTHRGPDDAGLWTDDSACLGSRRLAVLDLSQSGHMPMTSADDRYSIVFNGEIYNYVELRDELSASVAFRSTGDTEVILNGFLVWGWPALLDRLDGMFAFGIWDSHKRTLYAARDRVGEKPFFHSTFSGGFAFASTLRALSILSGGVPQVSAAGLDAYLTYQALPAPLTIFKGFEQLQPAHALTFDCARGALSVSRYWDLRYSPKRRVGEREAIETVDGLVRRSVRERLRSDVATGSLLSGGVDSSLITAMASQESSSGIDAVTLGYEGPEPDERPYARVVAERYGVRLHEEVLAPAVVRDLPAIVWQYGQPLADVSIVPNYHLAAAARRFMTVALVGDGADEAFGGYTRPMLERVAPFYRSSLPHSLRRLLQRRLGEKPGRRSHGSIKRQIGLLVDAGADSASDAFIYDRAFRSLRADMYSPSLLAALGASHPDALYASVWSSANGEDAVDRALYGDMTTYLPDQLLAKADVSSMAFGLETRSPFLSRALLEYSATLPTSLRLKGFETKYLLKRVAERYVPKSAIYRRKRGFVIPVSEWLRSDLSPYVRGLLDSDVFHSRNWLRPDAVRRLIAEHMDGSRDWGNQIWTLLVLEIWARLTLDGSLAPSDTLDRALEQ